MCRLSVLINHSRCFPKNETSNDNYKIEHNFWNISNRTAFIFPSLAITQTQKKHRRRGRRTEMCAADQPTQNGDPIHPKGNPKDV